MPESKAYEDKKEEKLVTFKPRRKVSGEPKLLTF